MNANYSAYPDEIVDAVYYNVVPLRGQILTELYREAWIEQIVKNISISTSPRLRYDVSLKSIEYLVRQVINEVTELGNL